MRNNDCRVYIIILWFSGRRHTSKQEHCIGLMYVPRVGNIWWFLILRIAREIMCDRSNYCIYGWNRFVLRKVLTLLTLPSGNTDDIRWDTPQHVLVDDVEGTDRPEIWPGTLVVLLLLSACPLTVWSSGKDYSNPRILDFYNLHKPDEDMYDRTTSPRMPWFVVSYSRMVSRLILSRHDVGLQVVGQPARDLARHFVQRYFYLLPIVHSWSIKCLQMELSSENKGLHMLTSGAANSFRIMSAAFIEPYTGNAFLIASAGV